jgi:hypothetical protein
LASLTHIQPEPDRDPNTDLGAHPHGRADTGSDSYADRAAYSQSGADGNACPHSQCYADPRSNPYTDRDTLPYAYA